MRKLFYRHGFGPNGAALTIHRRKTISVAAMRLCLGGITRPSVGPFWNFNFVKNFTSCTGYGYYEALGI